MKNMDKNVTKPRLNGEMIANKKDITITLISITLMLFTDLSHRRPTVQHSCNVL